MNEKILEEILSWLNSTKDFINSEIPQVIQEYLAWGFWGNIVVAFFLMILIISLMLFAYWFKIKQDSDERALPAPWFIGTVVCLIFAFIASIAMIDAALDAIKTQIAPRAYLIDKFIRKK